MYSIKKRVFIGSSKESKEVAEMLKNHIEVKTKLGIQ